MNITLTGASGFIGRRLTERLLGEGHTVHALGRRRPSANVGFSQWDAESERVAAEALDNADGIVHLAGEPVAQRWNRDIKSRIRNSRVVSTHGLVKELSRRASRPRVMVSASAIGYYGDRGDEVLEESSRPGKGFLADVCLEWEREARAAQQLGLRVVIPRIGIVLGKEGGALKQMLAPFRLGMGGPMASGRQWMSWIHADDLVELILFCLRNDAVSGAVNATSPNPVRNSEFAKALGDALGRPAILHTPVFALKMMLGEAAGVVLASQRVLPTALQSAGFEWRHPEVGGALRHVV
jgi:uncharacterized protein (TIGR01777 family)